VCSEDHLADPGLHQGACTHWARLQGHQQGAVVESPIAPYTGGLLQGHQFRVAQRVLIAFAPITAPTQSPPLAIHENGSHRNFPFAAHGISTPQKPMHPEGLLRRLQILCFCSGHNASD
jgi:hypothetical protein